MSEQTELAPGDVEFVGYSGAAEYLGLKPGTLSAYMGTGYGPKHRGRRVRGPYNQYVFWKSDLDEWKAGRPGQGARTDRMHAGFGVECNPCGGVCSVQMPA